jgi:hypothetical protein
MKKTKDELNRIADQINDAILAASAVESEQWRSLRNAIATGGTGGIDSDIVHPTTIADFIVMIEPLTR